jgi:AcrR family transcriptional regulator
MGENNIGQITKDRLLDEAEVLFAEKGYNVVSVREITAAAKCNMGAVNYHFGGKKNLYLEVFRSRWVPRELRMHEYFRRSLEGRDNLSPATLIQALGRAFLEGPLSKEELRTHRQLIIREINNPTDAFEIAADQTLRPLFEYLQRHLTPFLPEHLDEESLTLDIMSIFGMLLYFNYSRPMISRITGRTYDQAFKARLIKHIVRFSLDGLSVNGKERP